MQNLNTKSILEVAYDWHEIVVPRHNMRSSIACNSGYWTHGVALEIYRCPNQPH